MNVDELQAASDTAERFAPDSDRGLDDRWLVEEIIVEAARLWLNPNILAAARSRYPLAVRFTFTQKQWDEIMEETRLFVAAALTPGDTPITNCGDVKQIRHGPPQETPNE